LIADLQTQTTSQNEFVKLPIIYADNQSAIKVARDPQHFGRMKHVDLREKMSKIKDLDLLKEAIGEIKETCLVIFNLYNKYLQLYD
jgi:hypothetical protein